MAAGRAAAMVAAAAAAAAVLLLLAGGAHADCYDDCFKDCMARFKSMRDYCSYACEKVCDPDATLQRPLAVVGPAAALADHHPLDKKHGAVWPAALPDHPFHETHGDVEPAGEPDPARHVVRPARVPVLP